MKTWAVALPNSSAFRRCSRRLEAGAVRCVVLCRESESEADADIHLACGLSPQFFFGRDVEGQFALHQTSGFEETRH